MIVRKLEMSFPFLLPQAAKETKVLFSPFHRHVLTDHLFPALRLFYRTASSLGIAFMLGERDVYYPLFEIVRNFSKIRTMAKVSILQ